MAISSLNPHAPLFVPAAFLAAEDFSPDWWRLVHTCPAFREYWIKECSDSYQDPELPSDLDLDDLDLDLCLDGDLDFHFDPELDDCLFSDGDEFEDLALNDCSYSLPVPPGPAPLKLHNFLCLPSAPLLPRALNVDAHTVNTKANLQDLATSKQRKHQFIPASSREKVPQIVSLQYKKSCPRMIQQPR